MKRTIKRRTEIMIGTHEIRTIVSREVETSEQERWSDLGADQPLLGLDARQSEPGNKNGKSRGCNSGPRTALTAAVR